MQLKNQTFKNKEIIYFDDLSSDNSISIIKKNKNIKLIQNKKRGKFGSYNQIKGFSEAFKKSKGDIVFLLDSDDYFLKNKVKFIVNLFKQEKNLNFVQDNPIYFYPSKNLQIKKKPKKNIYQCILGHILILQALWFLKEIF